MPKKLGLLYVSFLTVPLYIQWYQFIIVQTILPTPYYQFIPNFILSFKRLSMNLFNIVTFLTLKVVLGYHPTRLKHSGLYSNLNCQSQLSQIQEYCCPNFLFTFKTKSLSAYSSQFWSCLYYQTKINVKKRIHGSSTRKSSPLGAILAYLSPYQGN